MISGSLPSRSRALLAARIVGIWALVVAAFEAVDPPDLPGLPIAAGPAVAVLLAVATIAGLIAVRRGDPFSRWVQPLLSSLAIGLLSPFLATDPLVAGAVIVWNLVLLTRHFFPIRPPRPTPGGPPPPPPATAGLRHLATVTLILTVCVAGYRISDGRLALLACWIAGLGALAASPPVLARRLHAVLPVAPALAGAALLAAGRATPSLALLGLSQVLLLGALATRFPTTGELLRSFLEHPSRLVVLSFAILIAAGTLALTFPAAAAPGVVVGPLDALFTATSAACVTGLIVLDTPRAFSPFGHGVLLVLMQVGGLGIMVLSTFATLLLGGRLGLRGEGALSQLLDTPEHPAAARLTRFIVATTLAIEAVGAVLLYFSFSGEDVPVGQAIWKGVFHAVSAFCNAGFALQSDSLAGFRESPATLLVVAVLIVLGGLGFTVLASLGLRLGRRGRSRLPTQTKVVLTASALLVASGAVLFALLERTRSLADLGPLDVAVNSLFQSVTLRTAGFNSVELSSLAPAVLFLFLLFMFVGASPGSTGGGIRTTTAAILFASVRSMIRGQSAVTLFDREIPRELVQRAVAIVLVSGLFVSVGFFLLLVLEPLPFQDLLFEAVSAFGTVGLSTGATPRLGPAGKLVITVLMFAGRTGPLTFVLLLSSRHPAGPGLRRPTGRLMVG